MDTKAASIGIIGGADGPTAIFVATPDPTGAVAALLLAAVAVFVFLRLRKKKSQKK